MHSSKSRALPVHRRIANERIFPDYPSNARSFIALDAKLLPYWHLLYDLCPSLLKLDPPEGLNLFRRFMVWAYRRQPAQDWTFHISVCRWLLLSMPPTSPLNRWRVCFQLLQRAGSTVMPVRRRASCWPVLFSR